MSKIVKTCFAVVVSFAALAGLQSAYAAWMDGQQIQTLLGGKEIAGEYANGRPFTERYLADGRIEYTDQITSLGGHWSVTAGTLCTIYDGDPAGGCFRVVRSGANCFEFYFVSRTEETAPGKDDEKPKWTARGSLSGSSEGCPDQADV